MHRSSALRAGAIFAALLLMAAALPLSGRADVIMETGNDGSNTMSIGGQNREVFGTQPGDNGASTMRTPPRPDSRTDPQDGNVLVAPEIYVQPPYPYPPYYPQPPRPPDPQPGPGPRPKPGPYSGPQGSSGALAPGSPQGSFLAPGQGSGLHAPASRTPGGVARTPRVLHPGPQLRPLLP